MNSTNHLATLIGNTHKIIENNHVNKEFFNSLPVAIYTCNQLGYITSFNKAAESLWGRKPEIGKDLWCGSWKIFHPNGEPLELDSCPMARALKEGIAIEGEEIVIERIDGSRLNVLPYPVPVFDALGSLTGAINTLIDVTEQRKADAKQAMLAAIIESSEDAIVSKTLNGIVNSWNSAAEQMFGYTEEEMIGKPITTLIPIERIQEEDLILSKIRNSEKVEHYETYRRCKDGKQIPVSLTISPIKDSRGRVIGASKIVRNISKQKLAEARLQRYAENLEELNSVGKVVSESLDMNEILQKATDATTSLTSASFGAFFYNKLDENDESLMLYASSGANKEAFKKFETPLNTAVFPITFSGEEIIRVDDITLDERYGKSKPLNGILEGHLQVKSYLFVPVISKSGTVIGGLFFVHEESAKFSKEHENLVIGVATQASIALDNAKLYEEIQKLNSKKDEFIGLASHELKTPLTSITAYLQILERTQSNEKNHKFLNRTIQQVNKLTALVSDLLDVSKIEAGKLQLLKKNFDIKSILEESIELIGHSHTNHKISLSTAINTLSIYGDPNRIEQVIINLLTNAIKYSPSEYEVEISLEHIGNQVKVGVKDSGIGIPRKMCNQIFSRFYRVDGLSPHMSGLGIGLYISKEIITQHNGKIWVESELGKGSTFWFTLPIISKPQPEQI